MKSRALARAMPLTLMFLLFSQTSASAHGIHAEELERLMDGSLVTFVVSGAKHMVTGYDHLLFLFGVMFFLTRMGDIFKYVTAFTLGHSLTLLIGTLLHTNANAYLIDAVIALTICYKGFDNIDGFRRFLKVEPPSLLMMIFFFGLVHGFGLATRLSAANLPEEGIVPRILSFNLGVEIGQVAALLVMIVILDGWRKTSSFAKLSTAANILLMLAGVGLFVWQISGYLGLSA